MATKTVFISYRTSDGTTIPSCLDVYLKGKGVDSYCALIDPANQDTLSEKFPLEISKRDNFVIIFTRRSLEFLIGYRSMPQNADSKDYVNIELEAALKNHCSIIPFCILEKDSGEKEFRPLLKELFCNTCHLQDDFRAVFCKSEESIDGFHVVESYLNIHEPEKHTDYSDIYWVGTRQSDIEHIANFKGYVLFFGDEGKLPKENTYILCKDDLKDDRVDHNDSSDLSQDQFVVDSVRSIIEKDSSARFMFYNPSSVYRLGLDKAYGKEHFVCLNDEKILDTVNNKRDFRELMQDIIPMLPIVKCTKMDCDYDELLKKLALEKGGLKDEPSRYGTDIPEIRYDKEIQFIIQAPVSSGGSGTFILNKENAKYLLSSLDPQTEYLVSVYHTKSIPVNVHILIDKKNILLLPASIQLEREVEVENKLLYKGADFVAYQTIDEALRNQFAQQATRVARKMQEEGYRGIFGIDAIIHDGRVNILEVNGRFQASTELINRAMQSKGYKTLQELNLDAFSDEGISETDIRHCRNTTVPYSNYAFSYEGFAAHNRRVYRQACVLESQRSSDVAQVQKDGYVPEKVGYKAQAYLFRVVFHDNISSISEDGNVLIHENICEPQKWLTKKIFAKEKLAVKLALMIQGICIDKSIQKTLREATNNAADLKIGSGKELMIINSPTNIRFVEFSPFDLRPMADGNDEYSIYYYDKLLISHVGVFPTDANQNKRLKDGKHMYSEVAYLSTDRLRVHLTNACKYKLAKKGCKFCNICIDKNDNPITPEDIGEVVDTYYDDMQKAKADGAEITMRHFLIGGQSLANSHDQLIKTAEVLMRYRLPIYAMTLPLPRDTVQALVDRQVYEFAYNIEIFDEKCREKYMPGKCEFSVEDYYEALRTTRRILNGVRAPAQKKVVRSMIIVGLDPYEKLITGVERLIELGVEPMFSVFRPLPDTELSNLNAPPIKMVYDLFHDVSNRLCEKSEKSLKTTGRIRMLGPECPCCQNNTVSLPWRLQTGRQNVTKWSIDPSQEFFRGE